jgi:hypothetical protein
MVYQKAKIKDNQVVITESKEVNQKTLNSDCWLVQIEGLDACETCPAKSTKDCGGGETLKSMNMGR